MLHYLIILTAISIFSFILAWAYGFLFVTLINICALIGVVVLPVMNTRIYKKVLLFLVALAAGSLAASGLLVLIPEVSFLRNL